jgi:HlyD family secretion protein
MSAREQGKAPRRAWLPLCSALALGCASCDSTEGAERHDLLVVAPGDVVYGTQITGRIVPREEVFVRSLVAGQLVELKVRPGDAVTRGDHLATVRIVADPVTLEEARARVLTAELRVQIARREVERLQPLRAGVAMSGKDLAQAEDAERLARMELESAKQRFRLIAEGAAAGAGAKSTRIVATVSGTVLATPAAVGDYISETNAYRDGTTLAVLADMTQLLFKGQVEEAYVGKIKLGMPAKIRIGALEGAAFSGRVTWIAPRASIELANAAPTPGAAPANSVVPLTASSAGITRFELWAELVQPPPDIRAGYSAAAELELERRDHVLVLEERALRFERGKVFARVQQPDGSGTDREVQVGVSDGLRIEIVSGLEAGDKVAVAAVPAAP